MSRLLVVCFFLVLGVSDLLGQLSSRDSLPVDEFLLDLDSLHNVLLESHPNPFEFCSEAKFEETFDQARQIKDSLISAYDMALRIATCLNVLQDSHTTIDFGLLQDIQLDDGGYYMPLYLERIDVDSSEYHVVIRSDWEDRIIPGSRLLSINGNKVEELFDMSMAFACVEGNALEARRAVATALIPIVTGLRYPFQEKNKLEIIQPNETDTLVVELPGYEQREYYKRRYERDKRDENKLLRLGFDDELSLAVLRVGTFSPQSYRSFRWKINSSMKKIKEHKSKSLILDLRNNGGGSSAWVEYLYSYLDDKGYNTPSNVIGRNSLLSLRRSSMLHSGFGKFIVKVFYGNNEDVISFLRLAELELGQRDTIYFYKPTKQRKGLVFDGDCYLLINGLTASAGVDFTNAFQSRKRGLVIGEQCLGPVTGTWGNPVSYRLENSGMSVSIATIRYNYDNTFVYDPNAIMPDHVVDWKAEDFSKRRDTQIEFVKDIIRKKQ